MQGCRGLSGHGRSRPNFDYVPSEDVRASKREVMERPAAPRNAHDVQNGAGEEPPTLELDDPRTEDEEVDPGVGSSVGDSEPSHLHGHDDGHDDEGEGGGCSSGSPGEGVRRAASATATPISRATSQRPCSRRGGDAAGQDGGRGRTAAELTPNTGDVDVDLRVVDDGCVASEKPTVEFERSILNQDTEDATANTDLYYGYPLDQLVSKHMMRPTPVAEKSVAFCGRNDVRALRCVTTWWAVSVFTVEKVSAGYDPVVASKQMSTPGFAAFGVLGFLGGGTTPGDMARIRCLNREWSDTTTSSTGYVYMFYPRGILYGKPPCVTQRHRDWNNRARERQKRLSVFPERLGRPAHVVPMPLEKEVITSATATAPSEIRASGTSVTTGGTTESGGVATSASSAATESSAHHCMVSQWVENYVPRKAVEARQAVRHVDQGDEDDMDGGDDDETDVPAGGGDSEPSTLSRKNDGDDDEGNGGGCSSGSSGQGVGRSANAPATGTSGRGGTRQHPEGCAGGDAAGRGKCQGRTASEQNQVWGDRDVTKTAGDFGFDAVDEPAPTVEALPRHGIRSQGDAVPRSSKRPVEAADPRTRPYVRRDPASLDPLALLGGAVPLRSSFVVYDVTESLSHTLPPEHGSSVEYRAGEFEEALKLLLPLVLDATGPDFFHLTLGQEQKPAKWAEQCKFPPTHTRSGKILPRFGVRYVCDHSRLSGCPEWLEIYREHLGAEGKHLYSVSMSNGVHRLACNHTHVRKSTTSPTGVVVPALHPAVAQYMLGQVRARDEPGSLTYRVLEKGLKDYLRRTKFLHCGLPLPGMVGSPQTRSQDLKCTQCWHAETYVSVADSEYFDTAQNMPPPRPAAFTRRWGGGPNLTREGSTTSEVAVTIHHMMLRQGDDPHGNGIFETQVEEQIKTKLVALNAEFGKTPIVPQPASDNMQDFWHWFDKHNLFTAWTNFAADDHPVYFDVYRWRPLALLYRRRSTDERTGNKGDRELHVEDFAEVTVRAQCGPDKGFEMVAVFASMASLIVSVKAWSCRRVTGGVVLGLDHMYNVLKSTTNVRSRVCGLCG